jgi:acetolactate synthase small subunit
MELDLGKISTIIGIVGALSASVGGYFVMEERQNVMMAEVKMLRESTSNIDLGAMKAKLDDISSSVSALDARVADSNPAEFTRKVERLEERLNNVVKALDRIQDNDNPLSM